MLPAWRFFKVKIIRDVGQRRDIYVRRDMGHEAYRKKRDKCNQYVVSCFFHPIIGYADVKLVTIGKYGNTDLSVYTIRQSYSDWRNALKNKRQWGW